MANEQTFDLNRLINTHLDRISQWMHRQPAVESTLGWLAANWPTIAITFSALIIYSFRSIYKHLAYQSHAFDLAIWAQTSWLVSHWMIPYSTVRMLLQPADHFAPTYLLLSLGYGIFNSPLYLLILQILSIFLGGIPVWLIAKNELKSRFAADMMLVAYFFQVGLIEAVSFDFSTTALSVGFISWAIYCWYKGWGKRYILLLVLSLGCKEDIPVLFGFFALYLCYRRQWTWGITTALLSLGWFLAVTHYIIPVLLHNPYQYGSIGGAFSGLPQKEDTLRLTFGQNLGFALLNPIGWVFAGANFATRFLRPVPNLWEYVWHYGANIAAPLTISTIFGIKWLSRHISLPDRGVAMIFSGSVAVATILLSPSFTAPVKSLPYNRHDIDAALQSIPSQASVSAQDPLAPHLSDRKDIYLFPNTLTHCSQPSCPPVEYIALAQQLDSWPLTPDQINEEINKYQHDPHYELASHRAGVYIFKRIANMVK
jgi:uncharacterized membrane protein